MATRDWTAELTELSRALRDLHRALLFARAREHERFHGPLAGPGELLHLATTDPGFAFLRPLSEFLVDLDALLDVHAADSENAAAVRGELSFLLGVGREDSDEHLRTYREMLQADAAVVMAHARALELLRALPAAAMTNTASELHEKHRWNALRRHREPEPRLPS